MRRNGKQPTPRVLLLHRPLLVGRHHRNPGVKRPVNLGVIFEADAIAEAGEARRKLRPECQALADRNVGVDRPKARDMLALHLAGDALCVHQAGLKST